MSKLPRFFSGVKYTAFSVEKSSVR